VTGEERRWTVGELAKATGLTVRTLHHYDAIGLVAASERTSAGHRRYTEQDLRRLYRVRALSRLGLSLAEIATVLADSADDLSTMRTVLAAQLAQLTAHATTVARLREQIGGLLARLDSDEMPDPDQFMTTLEMTTMVDSYFTQEQRDKLTQRSQELGTGAVEAMKVEWMGLARELMGLQQANTPVDDPRVQALTKRWDEIGTAFHDNDRAILAASDTAWEHTKADVSSKLGWPAPGQGPDLVDYVKRAREERTGHVRS
jgi:DNA-binding transcriptional MerR regulator